MKLKRTILTGVTIASMILVGCSNNNLDQNEIVNSNTEKKDIDQVVEKQEYEEIVNLPEYKVELIDNSNIGNVIRETLHIIVEGDYTLEELEAIAKKEAISYTKENKVNALIIGFYRNKDNIGKGYDMGKVEYVPNGNLGDAINVIAGDYSDFEFVNYLEKHIEFEKGEDIKSTVGESDLEQIKSDILDIESSSIVDINKNGDTLVINIKEQEDHPFVQADENAISVYTDWCLENIKSDISKLDICIDRPSSSVRAILDMNDMETSNGRYFDTNYIAENII